MGGVPILSLMLLVPMIGAVACLFADAKPARMIALDDADVMVAGGAENALCRIGIAGFLSIEIISEFLASPMAKIDEQGAAERPLGPDRASEIAADE